MDKRVVRPAREGLLVPDPEHRDMLPEVGREVRWSNYWESQLRDGSIIVTPIPTPAPAKNALPEKKTP